MENITLEKVDQVKSRTGVSYAKAKQALEHCNGDVLNAIIFIEENNNEQKQSEFGKEENTKAETVDEFKDWLKELINKGNVTRLKLKKDDEVLVDVPVNAGIAAAVIAIVLPPVLAFVVIAAVATKITVEITKSDGSVEVINKYVAKAANEVKEKTTSFASQVKEKFTPSKENKEKNRDSENIYKGDGSTFSYTVKFDDDKEQK
ncbi:MAG: DUF4342 domain-containing protein [Clostridiaceae bacterium]|nr:DUF4342 domain-containing protein [Clostridiaceae bacterium]